MHLEGVSQGAIGLRHGADSIVVGRHMSNTSKREKMYKSNQMAISEMEYAYARRVQSTYYMASF
jgi:hypothetical protein